MAELLRKQNKPVDPERLPVGSEAVARELDELNAKYQRLLDMMYERLRRIATANPGDIVTLVSVSLFEGDVSCVTREQMIVEVAVGRPFARSGNC